MSPNVAPGRTRKVNRINLIEYLMVDIAEIRKMKGVLFGLRTDLVSHLVRSSLGDSDNYHPLDDRITCFANFALKHESLVQHLG